MLRATNCAALPMSLAFLDSGWRSREIRSMAASTAELSNSTISTSNTLPIIAARPTPLTGRKKLAADVRSTERKVRTCLAALENMGIIKEFKEFAMRGNVLDMAVGVVVGGWLAAIGINWGAKKMDDASATLGFLTIVASLTAIGVAATLVLRKN